MRVTRTIRVMRKHINEGEQECATLCPIALAWAERYGTECHVGRRFIHVPFATGRKSHLLEKSDWGKIELPHEARDFVKFFDVCGKSHVKPLTFEVTYTRRKGGKKS